MATSVDVRDEFVVLNGLRFHYRDWGDAGAPPLLMLHGTGLTARSYDTLARDLSSRWRVLALDLRGHGQSDRAADYGWERAIEDIEGFVSALGLTSLRVMGHSIGAQLAAVYAARNPAAVERVVLIDWTPGAVFTPEYGQALGQLFGQPRITDPEAVLQGARAGQPRLRADEFRHVIVTNLAPHAEGGWVWRFDPAALATGLAFPMDEGTAAGFLRAVRCPTLLIRAAESQYVTPEQAEHTVRQLASGHLVEITECGHGLPWEQSERLHEAVRTFLLDNAG